MTRSRTALALALILAAIAFTTGLTLGLNTPAPVHVTYVEGL